MPDTLTDPAEATELLGLPYIISAQAQKHVTHNEALRMLDALVQIAVASRTASAPPAEPAIGERRIVPDGGEAVWGEPAGALVAWQDGAWAAYRPAAGWVVWVEDEARLLVHDGAAWVGAGGDGGPRTTLGINATADETNRLAVSAPATLLTHEGGDHRLTINKAGEADTASLVLQSEWRGRAEIGLAGEDDLSFKVSDDGAAWRTALLANRATGSLRFPAGANGDHLLPGSTAEGDAAIGPPNMLTVSQANSNLTLARNRVYFAPVLVDRPTELLGARATIVTASQDTGALRAALYRLGGPNGTGWNPGSRVVEFGALDPSIGGIAAFDLADPIELEPGWYLTAIGTNRSGAVARYASWMTPGATALSPHGANADLRAAGATTMLIDNGQAALIEGGFPAKWPNDRIISSATTTHYARQLLMPRWRRWNG